MRERIMIMRTRRTIDRAAQILALDASDVAEIFVGNTLQAGLFALAVQLHDVSVNEPDKVWAKTFIDPLAVALCKQIIREYINENSAKNISAGWMGR